MRPHPCHLGLILLISLLIAGLLAPAGVPAAGVTEKWRIKLSDFVPYSPAIGPDGTIYVQDDNHFLHAITPGGASKWSIRPPTTGFALLDAPTIGADGTVYKVGGDYLYALNPSNGTPKWAFKADGSLEDNSVALGADCTIYCNTASTLYALNPQDASIKWQFVADLQLAGSPVIGANGTVYVQAIGKGNGMESSGGLFAVNPQNGLQAWFCPFDPAPPYLPYPNPSSGSPAIGPDGTLYMSCATDVDYLIAISPNGTGKWKSDFYTSGLRGSPVIGTDNNIYVATRDGGLYNVTPTGSITQIWSKPYPPNSFTSTPAVGANSVLYIGSLDYNVYAVSQGGIKQWEFPTGNAVRSSPAMAPDGTLYVGSDDGYLYALETGCPSLASSSWPMLRQNARHTGGRIYGKIPGIFNLLWGN